MSQHLGWRSIFWFLAIYASTVWIFCAAFLPETSRDLVGNGSIPPGKWNMTLTSYLQRGRRSPVQIGERSAAELSLCPEEAKSAATRSKTRHVNPLNSLKLFGEEETGILLLYSGLIYANSYMVLSTLPDELEKGYGLDTLHISLCFLASGFGSVASATFTGRLLDWNFRRHARLVGMEISNQKQQDLSRFPIELARLQISVPALILAGASLVAYSWTLQARIHLSVPLILLFLQSFGSTSAFSGFSNLIMDLNRKKPGTASAAMNLSRCWMGAGGTVFATPLVTAAGIGWLGVTIAGLWFLFSPLVLLVLRYGPRWRDEKRLREEEAVPNNSLPASGARTT